MAYSSLCPALNTMHGLSCLGAGTAWCAVLFLEEMGLMEQADVIKHCTFYLNLLHAQKR